MLWPSSELGFGYKMEQKFQNTDYVLIITYIFAMKITSAAPLPSPNGATLKPGCIESSRVFGASMHQICGMDIFLHKKCNKIVRFKNIFFAPCRASRPILPTARWCHWETWKVNGFRYISSGIFARSHCKAIFDGLWCPNRWRLFKISLYLFWL